MRVLVGCSGALVVVWRDGAQLRRLSIDFTRAAATLRERVNGVGGLATWLASIRARRYDQRAYAPLKTNAAHVVGRRNSAT